MWVRSSGGLARRAGGNIDQQFPETAAAEVECGPVAQVAWPEGPEVISISSFLKLLRLKLNVAP